MFRLTREVRFAIHAGRDRQLDGPASNSYGGYPSITGLAVYYSVRVTLGGDVARQSQYLVNIKDVDDAVRQYLRTAKWSLAHPLLAPERLLRDIYQTMVQRWAEGVQGVALCLSPLLTLSLD